MKCKNWYVKVDSHAKMCTLNHLVRLEELLAMTKQTFYGSFRRVSARQTAIDLFLNISNTIYEPLCVIFTD